MTTELIEPELLEQTDAEDAKKMATGLHGKISMRLGRYLDVFVDENRLGHVLDSSTTYNFQDGQPKRMPDVSFIPYATLSIVPDEILTVIPALAVGVVSKNDTAYEIAQKVTHYQKAGVKLIWIVYPFSTRVEVYRQADGFASQSLTGEQELDGEQVLAGFRLPVSKIFERINSTIE